MTMKWKSIGLSLLLIISMVGGVAALSGSASAAPSGFVSVTDSQVYSDLPEQTPMGQTAQEIANAGVLTNEHPETLEVITTTPGRAKQFSDGAILGGGPIAIVLRDDINDAGRTVALPKGPIEDALGYQPEMARGTHDSGMPWNSEIEYQDGWMLVDVPHFSTNTVTFAGQVQIGDTFSDGSQVQYGVSDLDAASDVTVNLTGVNSTEYDNVSGAGVGVDFTTSLSVAGNAEPTDGSGSDPLLSVTGYDGGYALVGASEGSTFDASDSTYSHSVAVGDNGTKLYVLNIDDQTIYQYALSTPYDTSTASLTQSHSVGGDPWGMTFTPDGTKLVIADGTNNQIVSYDLSTAWDVTSASQITTKTTSVAARGVKYSADGSNMYVVGIDVESFSLSTNYDISSASSTGTTTLPSTDDPNGIAFDSDGSRMFVADGNDADVDIYQLSTEWDASTRSYDTKYSTSTADDLKGIWFANDGKKFYTVATAGGPVRQFNTTDPISDVSVSDGAGKSHTFTGFSDGETQTTNLPLTIDSTELNFSGNSGVIDYSLTLQERSVTEDPGVELNDGNWANHTGTLADGETVQYTINSSALQEGTNTINVSMPSLSADAPPMQIQVEYVHDAQDDQTVEYEAEKFTERYNVSKTYSSDRTNPTLTIPFADEAVAIRQAEYRVNGGDWQTTTDWVVENTTGTVHLPDVQANDTIDVRANASKVTVQNGEIKVLEPTPIGSDLDSKIEVTSAQGSEELVLGIGSSPDANLAHTTYEESWTADPYGVISTNDHEFHLPDAAAGSVFRVKTTPMEISPRSNDVVYEVPDDSDSLEPKIELSPGSTSGDTVDLTFTDAADGQSYNLMSLTFGTVRDDGTASSPLTLTDDDSDEILQFQVEDDGGSTDDTSGAGFWQDQISVQSVQEAAPVVDPRFIALLMLAIVGIAVFYTEEDDELDDKPVHQRKLVWFGVGMSFLFGLLFLDPRAFTGPLQNALDATLPIAGILGVIAILVSVVMWWRSRQAEAGSPDTVLQFNGKTIGGTDNPSEDDKGGGWL